MTELLVHTSKCHTNIDADDDANTNGTYTKTMFPSLLDKNQWHIQTLTGFILPLGINDELD